MKLGATDYLTKPFDLPRLRQLLRDVRAEAELRRAVLALEGDVAQRLEFCGMIGRGPAMQDVFDLIRRLAPHARTVLVTGETGTGKELVARALHRLGPRGDKRFVTVNCSAVVETLFESELFGHVRGRLHRRDRAQGRACSRAPTAARCSSTRSASCRWPCRPSCCACSRTARCSASGSVEPRKVDVRLIAATNRDLRAEVAAGRFRADLYYRLNIVEVALPPLRDRREDIPYLTAAFVRGFSQRFSKPLVGLTPGAERMLAEATWDGNVRQLRNVLERACMLADGEYVTESDLAGIMREQRVSTFSALAARPRPLRGRCRRRRS